MAVDESRIITDNTEFLNATNQIIAERDAANDELNAFLDPLVIDLGGDPNHLKFAAKKVNYILENENEWASSNTLGGVKFNYEKRLNTVRDLAKQAEFQIKVREKALKQNDVLIEQLAVELQTIREQNVKIQQENAAIETKIKAYDETVKSIDKEIESLSNQNDSNNNNKNRVNYNIIKSTIQDMTVVTPKEMEVNYNIIKSTMERKTATLDKIAELKGNLESNKLKLVSDKTITARQNKLSEYQRKQMEAYTKAQEQKTYLINEFKKDKIDLNLTDSADAPEKAEEQAKEEKQQQVKGGGAGGVVAAPAIETQTDSRTTKQLVDDMYKRLTENGKIDAETRKRILSGMGYSDLIDMASKMSMWKRHNVNKLLDATLKDLGRLDNAKALKLDELLFDKFGVADAYSALAEGDFSKLSEEQLSDIKKIIDTFNDNPDNYTREEQILIDEFAKRVSLKSLSYQMKRAGVFGRVAECFTPRRQSRRDVHASFNTFAKNKSNRVKNVANSDFALEMKANVRTDDEISMSPSSSLQDKQRQYSRGERS